MIAINNLSNNSREEDKERKMYSRKIKRKNSKSVKKEHFVEK
jgi:hypothetical protein